MQEIHLPAALQFAQHRFADHAISFVAHEGANRQPPLRRSGDHGKIADALQRHAHGARDRRSGQREHIHFGAERLHRFLVAHAKAVLFIDDQQPQVFELRFFAQKFVRSDDDVHAAVCNAFERGGNFFCAAKAAHFHHFDRPL